MVLFCYAAISILEGNLEKARSPLRSQALARREEVCQGAFTEDATE